MADVATATTKLREAARELLHQARASVPELVTLGGGPRSLKVRILDSSTVVVGIFIDCRDAMGANMVNTVAEAIGPRCAGLAQAALGLRILSNLCDRRRVLVSAEIPVVAGLCFRRSSRQ